MVANGIIRIKTYKKRLCFSNTGEARQGIMESGARGAEAIVNGKPSGGGVKAARKSSEGEQTNAIKVDPKTTLFFEAIREGSVQKVKAILRGKNMNMNTRDLNDDLAPTALIVACETDNADIVKLLLTMKKARSLDVNQENKIGRRPIW